MPERDIFEIDLPTVHFFDLGMNGVLNLGSVPKYAHHIGRITYGTVIVTERVVAELEQLLDDVRCIAEYQERSCNVGMKADDADDGHGKRRYGYDSRDGAEVQHLFLVGNHYSEQFSKSIFGLLAESHIFVVFPGKTFHCHDVANDISQVAGLGTFRCRMGSTGFSHGFGHNQSCHNEKGRKKEQESHEKWRFGCQNNRGKNQARGQWNG